MSNAITIPAESNNTVKINPGRWNMNNVSIYSHVYIGRNIISITIPAERNITD